MTTEKKITAPKTVWDRLRGLMDREGFGSVSEAVRHCIRVVCDESERRADK